MVFAHTRASDFREEVIVVSDTDVADGRGGFTSTPIDGEVFFAQVEEKTKTKIFEGGGQTSVKQTIVKLRDGPPADMLKDRRFKWVNPEGDTVILRVLGLESSERRVSTNYLCEEVPADR